MIFDMAVLYFNVRRAFQGSAVLCGDTSRIITNGSNKNPLIVRCPRHAIQFMGYGYSKYVEEVLGIVGLVRENMEFEQYERWTPYG